MIRLLYVLFGLLPGTFWYGARMVWTTRRGSPNASCVCERSGRSWARMVMKLASVDVALENEGVLDPDRPQILVANHQSWFDVLALIAGVPGKTVFVGKKELRKVPIFGPATAACGHIFIDRGDRRQSVGSLEVAKQKLNEASPTVVMFPEGTRSADGVLQRFKKGAFVLAIQAGVDIVPAAIFNTRDIMPKGTLKIRGGHTINVRSPQPPPVAGLTMDDRNELTERAWQAVKELQASP